jgi:hypothetical protein
MAAERTHLVLGRPLLISREKPVNAENNRAAYQPGTDHRTL